MNDAFESFKAANDRRYANALALSADYAATFLDKAIDIALRASAAPDEFSKKLMEYGFAAMMSSPEVIAALVAGQAHVFAALSASLDEEGFERALGEASSEISAAVRSLDKS